MSPTFILTISPTTMSFEEILTSCPERSTVAMGAESERSDCMVFSAFISCTNPIPMLRQITAVMTPPSIQSLVPNERAMAISRTRVSELDTWRANIWSIDTQSALSSSLWPFVARRVAATASERPSSRLDSSRDARNTGVTV